MSKKKNVEKPKETTPSIDPERLAKIVTKAGKRNLDTETSVKEYDPMQHDVFDRNIRKMKKVAKPTGVRGADGKMGTKDVDEEVNRIAIPLQKLITSRRTAFINAGQMILVAKPKMAEKGKEMTDQQRLLAIVNKIREDNKMQYRETEIVRRSQVELQAAKLWYAIKTDRSHWGDLVGSTGGSFKLHCKVLSPELGDTLLPVFDSYGNLVYFARSYDSDPDYLNDPDAEDGKVMHLEVFDKTHVWSFTQDGGVWIPKTKIKHGFKKIPVIYYEEKQTPWADVQPMISRLETVLSNFADTTDYNGAPILVASGEIIGMAERGERGKTFQLKEKADLKYVTWEQAPDAIKLEIDTLIDFIYTCTQTADISTKGMANLGVKSGTGMDRVFVDPQLAATNFIAGGYGECTQRDINFLKSAAIDLIDTSLQKGDAKDLEIKFEIPVFKINDEKDTVETTVSALEGGLISQETAVALSGLSDDPVEEFERIQKEKENKEVEKETLLIER